MKPIRLNKKKKQRKPSPIINYSCCITDPCVSSCLLSCTTTSSSMNNNEKEQGVDDDNEEDAEATASLLAPPLPQEEENDDNNLSTPQVLPSLSDVPARGGVESSDDSVLLPSSDDEDEVSAEIEIRRRNRNDLLSSSFVYMQEASMEVASALVMVDDDDNDDDDNDNNNNNNLNGGDEISSESSSPRLVRIHASGRAGKRRPSSTKEDIIVKLGDSSTDTLEVQMEDNEEEEAVSISLAKAVVPLSRNEETIAAAAAGDEPGDDGGVGGDSGSENDGDNNGLVEGVGPGQQHDTSTTTTTTTQNLLISEQENNSSTHQQDDLDNTDESNITRKIPPSTTQTPPQPPPPSSSSTTTTIASSEQQQQQQAILLQQQLSKQRQQQPQKKKRRTASSVLNQYNLISTTTSDSPSTNKDEADSNNEIDEVEEEDTARMLHQLFEGFCHPPLDLETVESAWEKSCPDAGNGEEEQIITIHHPVVIACNSPKSKVVALLSAGCSSPSGPAIFELPYRFSRTFLYLIISLLTAGDDTGSEKEKQLLYSAARFQCHMDWKIVIENEKEDERPALTVLQRLCELSVQESASSPSSQLLEPCTRLLGLLCVAGTTPRTLQYLLSNCSARGPCFVRALRTATQTVDDVQNFFCLDAAADRGAGGLQRTLTGRQWPFRNDFCFATSFRAECFSSSSKTKSNTSSRIKLPSLFTAKQPPPVVVVLMSCRASNGAGFELRLVPPSPQQNCAVIQVCVYDSSSAKQSRKDHSVTHRTLTVRQCVLLPRVWYHLSVRHTRSRLKGVFSLATRQQLSVLLNGKILLTESCDFPKMEGDDLSYYHSTLLPKQRMGSNSNLINLTVTVGANFDGQIGSTYILDEHVSEASLRALYESSSQLKSKILRRRSKSASSSSSNPAGLINDNSWDAHKSNVVKKSRVLDVNITNDDAEEIVLSQKSFRKNESFAKTAVDAVGDSDNEDVEEALQKANFASKIFLAWDPKRTVEGSVVEIHIGAHVNKLDHAYSWNTNRAQDGIASIGGIQTLVPVFRAVLTGSPDLRASNPLYEEALSDLFLTLKSFLHDHNDNARELLRCGGVDVIEQLIYSNRKGPLFRAIQSQRRLSQLLVQSLLELRSACSHYVGLETKVFSRLLFNIPLWLGSGSGVGNMKKSTLQIELLPLLSTLTKSNPEKVRDCIGIKDMVHALKDYLEDLNVKRTSVVTNEALISDSRQVADILLGMIFEVLVSGVSPHDLSPFLNFLTFHLESEWNEASRGMLDSSSTPFQHERQRITANLSTTLLFLLQIRPSVPGLFESFAHCCGGAHGGAAWILSGMVNSYDDKVRSLGVRCVAAYLDVTSKSADSPLTVGVTQLQTAESDLSTGDSHHSSVLRLGLIAAKGLAAMGPSGVRSMVIPPSKLTARVVMKLLWHLLKSHRTHLGPMTCDALLYWVTDDNGLVSSLISSTNHVQNHLITKSNTDEPGYRFCMEWADNILTETSNIIGRSFCMNSPLALGVVLRLLRYLEGEMQDQWLSDLLTLSKASRKSTSMLASLPEWQPTLFHLISETLELYNSTPTGSTGGDVNGGESVDPSRMNGDTSSHTEDEKESKEVPSRDVLLAVGKRLDRCLELYSTLLGHLFREGGDKALDAVEKAASLQRVCVNGHDVIFLVLSGLCANVFDNGTLLEIGSIPAQDWKDIDIEQESLPLKQSARLVTDAILSNGTKGLDMTAAVRSWRSLRHLTEIIVGMVIKSGFGVVDLFDYINQQAYSVDAVSGGLNGLRLPDYRLSGIGSSDYLAFVQAAGGRRSSASADRDTSTGEADFRRDVDRRLCALVAAQILTILDAFIFPDSLDEALPASQLHGLALVRNSEPRLGTSQGPLVSSAIRLSLILLALLEPCSVKLLQCASRMRALLYWALELIREAPASSPEGKPKAFDERIAPLDRVVVATVLHCHRALGRCAALQSEIESSHEKYFDSRESHKKHYRRLLRVVLELRDVVYTAYRGRNEVLQSSLSSESFEALRVSLEGSSSNSKSTSKEAVAREFLQSQWVSGFQDVETRMDLAVPEQLSMETVPLSSDQLRNTNDQGFATVQVLSQESSAIVSDFEKSLNSCFEEYLEAQRKWAETDAVRDLEFDGDSTLKLLSEKYKGDSGDIARAAQLRRSGADNRWRGIHRKVVEPWESNSHWRLARYTDRLGRRTLLVQNRHFTDHMDASYELMLEKERDKAEKERQARLLEKELSEVMRRNIEAFTVQECASDVEGSEDDISVVQASDGESSTGVESTGGSGMKEESVFEESEHEEEWDKIETEEIKGVDAEGADIDAWAKAFIWTENEHVVARFERVMILSLQMYIECMLLLTTHGLYFHQVSDPIDVITKEPMSSADIAAMSLDSKDRRYRLSRLTEIHGRRYHLKHQALELFFSDSHELFLNFPGGSKERDRFHAKLRNNCKVPMLWSPKSMNPRTVFRKSKLSELWKKRKISNFEYLMALNRMAGRSFNDITQYPVFPWILADYKSDTIDLTDSRVYRDLTKPVGALNPDRLAQLLERYKDLELFGFTEAERFLYGSHYSSPGIVMHFLIRQEPFTTMAVELQSGRFDCPDRLFYDIASSWDGCLTSTSDMKELIPEFFCLPEMFLNTNNFPLGHSQSGRLVDNVELPKWAKGSAYEFVRIHRLALESEFVSQNLHRWIDLIFGFKQRGPEAEAAHNIFHHLSYEGSVDLDKIADEVDRQAAESHIQNFGQTPSQLIVAEPHPSRYGPEECWKPLIYNQTVPQRLRSLTPAKQFGNKRSEHANGAVMGIFVLSETVIAVYADMSIGTYRWFPGAKTNRLRMDKLRPMSRRELSTSRGAIKRGTAIPQDKLEQSSRAVGNWCFAVTIGGRAKEELRRKAVLSSSRIMSSTETTLASAEMAGLLISCGYWDDTVKATQLESLRPVASETGGHRGPIRCLAVGQDGGLMVTGGQDCTCRVWVVEHPDMAIALSDGYVQTALGASNDGDQVLSCCHVLWGHNTAVVCIDLDSDLDAVVSGSQSGLLCVHTLRRGEFIRSFRPPGLESGTPTIESTAGAVQKVALDTTGNLVVHMEDFGLHTYTINAVRLCSTNTGEELCDMKICSNGEMLVTGGTLCKVFIRTVANLNICAMLDLTKHGPIRSLAITPDDLNPTEQFLFVGSDDGMITIVDEDPQLKQQHQKEASIARV